MNDKPALASVMLRRHLWAAALTLGVVMLGMLAAADQGSLRLRARTLAQELRAEPVPDTFARGMGMGRLRNAGLMVLDAGGRWQGGPGRAGGNRRGWPPAEQVLAAGQLHGVGMLPWVPERVVWAAQVVTHTTGEPFILVRWDRVSAVRAATSVTYGAVILATLLAFAVSMLLALRTARYVTGALDAVADSGGRLATGDYAVRLPEQSTKELDRVSTGINRLAEDLEHTVTDLQAEHARLRGLEEAQRRFVADASHELRAPLTHMRVTLEAWQDGVLRPEEQAAAAERLLRETERLGALVGRLLDLSRIETGREAVALDRIDLWQVAREVLGEHAEVALEMPDDLPLVLADADAVFRILQNLVENARRFTPPDGRIRVWARVEEPWVRLGVTDSGRGIPPEFLPAIWDRFARAPDARENGTAGSGLGLAIVKALAEAMGGTVGAESEPGHGATVWVRLRTDEASTPMPLA
ncbi:MAG: sensor histidine kinase [Armatimonadota bacterium]